jgi:hypothetical protein
VRRQLLSPRHAARRQLARREVEFNGPSHRIVVKSTIRITVEHTLRHGRTRVEINPPTSRYEILDWLRSGPPPELLVGLQDWSTTALLSALTCVEHAWMTQILSESTASDDDDDDPIVPPISIETLHARFFRALSLWEPACIRARGVQVCTRLFCLQAYDADGELHLFSRLDWLDELAEGHPELVAALLHSWLGVESDRNTIMGVLLSEGRPHALLPAGYPGSATLRYRRVLDAALRVDDLLIFMTTADEAAWPEGERYGRHHWTGFAASAGEVMRRWMHGSTVISPHEFLDSLMRHLFHPEWTDPGCSSPAGRPSDHQSPIHPHLLTDKWLLPLVRAFTHTSDAQRLADYRSWLTHGPPAERSLRDTLVRSISIASGIDSQELLEARPCTPSRAHLPKLYDESRALPREHCLWPSEWLVGAC